MFQQNSEKLKSFCSGCKPNTHTKKKTLMKVWRRDPIFTIIDSSFASGGTSAERFENSGDKTDKREDACYFFQFYVVILMNLYGTFSFI